MIFRSGSEFLLGVSSDVNQTANYNFLIHLTFRTLSSKLFLFSLLMKIFIALKAFTLNVFDIRTILVYLFCLPYKGKPFFHYSFFIELPYKHFLLQRCFLCIFIFDKKQCFSIIVSPSTVIFIMLLTVEIYRDNLIKLTTFQEIHVQYF